MINLTHQKGQGIVEFALVLAFVTVIGLAARDGGLLEAASSLLAPAEKILYKIDHYRDYDLAGPIANIESFQSFYHEGGDRPGANQRNYTRGMVRSGWIDDNPPDNTDSYNKTLINTLRDELGAAQWTYLNGVNKNSQGNTINVGNYSNEFKGFYWTIQELTMDVFTLNSTSQKNNYSNEEVLQYFYYFDTNTNQGLYFIGKSRVWLSQEDVQNKVALGALGKQYNKPAGHYVQLNADGTTTDVPVGDTLDKTKGFSSLEKAKEVFETARAQNNGDIVFR